MNFWAWKPKKEKKQRKRQNVWSKKSKKKRELWGTISTYLPSSNPNNRPTYSIPTEANNEKSALKDAEYDVCHVKFTKQGFDRHRNSRQTFQQKKRPLLKS